MACRAPQRPSDLAVEFFHLLPYRVRSWPTVFSVFPFDVSPTVRTWRRCFRRFPERSDSGPLSLYPRAKYATRIGGDM